MIVSHNLMAMNTNRMFGVNTKSKAKSAEKLSSGYRINRAADDAAGLAISEKMRRQIRGLDKGAENIQDGISMVQTAEGALNEVSDMLQRINELSIKAYNDTNTQEDREMIQQEISQILVEIDRVAETTTFNELPLLKGNPTREVPEVIGEDEVISFVYKVQATKELPSWVTCDKKLEVHRTYTGVQDQSKHMLHTDTNGAILYWGPQDAALDSKGYIHQGPWSESIENNPSAKVSFANLANVDDAEKLYSNLSELIGSSIGTPCGTCSQKYFGINFTASSGSIIVDGMSYAYTERKMPLNDLDLTAWRGFQNEDGKNVNCFEKITELMKKHSEDTTLTEDGKKVAVKALAQEIAGKLTDEALRIMNIDKTHFSRALKSGDYDIIMYDYRDDSALTHLTAADSTVITKTNAIYQISDSYVAEAPTVISYVEEPLLIVGSAQFNDKIPIKLPKVTTGSIGIDGYNIANYQTTELYSEEYAEKLRKWEEGGIWVTKSEEQDVPVVKVVGTKFVNGEPKNIIEITTERKMVEWSEFVPNGPKPEPGPGDVTYMVSYEPSDVKQIKDALQYISSERSKLGATQNRLEHAYNANLNTEENTTAAESRIRDTDMAKEMLQYSNYNILEQVGHAMMAQANQSNQGVLNLLG